MSRKALLILGNQLFPHEHLKSFSGIPVFMAESFELCTYVHHHKQKIILFLSAMRHYRDGLEKAKWKVHYRELDIEKKKEKFVNLLESFIIETKTTELCGFEVEDKHLETQISKLTERLAVTWKPIPSPMFLNSRQDFRLYLDSVRKPFMKTFYEQQRRQLDILMEADGKPTGGKYSFDTMNRKKLPPEIALPKTNFPTISQHVKRITPFVEKHFSEHPGNSSSFCWPVTRKDTIEILKQFLEKKFALFGPYQDAMTTRDDFLFHSLIAPSMNMGLITPAEVVKKTVFFAKKSNTPIECLEGFIRQVIGWREFVRGIYQNFNNKMQNSNYWNHYRRGKPELYAGKTGIYPFDQAVIKAQQYGYCHHIERLMILANFLNLCEIEPKEVFNWFMTHFVDSSDWVMAANVYGMGLMSEGGIFATKPYISGSNYILKMSDYAKGEWCEVWNGLYWRFIAKNKNKFSKNPRMSMIVRAFEKMAPERRDKLNKLAESFLDKFTEAP